jgi:hypothetical protein
MKFGEKMNEKMKGVISIKNLATGDVKTFKNIVTAEFFNAIADFFTGSPGEGIRYLGIGTGTPVIDESTTALTTELFRKYVSNFSTDDSIMTFLINIDASEAVGTWTEVGLFENSSGAPMFTIAAVDYEHVEGEALSITYTISRA